MSHTSTQQCDIAHLLAQIHTFAALLYPGFKAAELVVRLSSGKKTVIQVPPHCQQLVADLHRKPDDRPLAGPGYRTVVWRGETYSFGPGQAGAVERLWKAWEAGTPDVPDAELLEAAESVGQRLRDVFKNSGAWDTIIVQGAGKGLRRLAFDD